MKRRLYGSTKNIQRYAIFRIVSDDLDVVFVLCQSVALWKQFERNVQIM